MLDFVIYNIDYKVVVCFWIVDVYNFFLRACYFTNSSKSLSNVFSRSLDFPG